MGALTSLILKDNKLLTPESGKVLSDMLAANTVLKELDVSSNNWRERGQMKGDGLGFAKELAVGISDNGVMTSLNLSSNSIGGYRGSSNMVATPEGTLVVTAVSLLLTLCFVCHRTSCYCRCHQEYEGVDVTRYQQQQHHIISVPADDAESGMQQTDAAACRYDSH
jgi:hypothetical protein